MSSSTSSPRCTNKNQRRHHSHLRARFPKNLACGEWRPCYTPPRFGLSVAARDAAVPFIGYRRSFLSLKGPMVATLCLLTCALATAQPPRADWLLAPQFVRGQELVYSGSWVEETLNAGVQFHRSYKVET